MQPAKLPATKPGETPKVKAPVLADCIAALESPDKTKWRDALNDLRQLQSDARPAWPKVVQLLADKDPVLVTAAEMTLASMGPLSRDDIATVMAAVDHPHKAIRRYAVETLGKMNDASSIPVLLTAAKDSNDKVSLSAIKALRELSIEHAAALDAIDRLLLDTNANRARLAAMELTSLPLNFRVLKSLASGLDTPHDAARNTILLYVESEWVQKEIPRFGSNAAELYGAIAARGSMEHRIKAIQNLMNMKEAASGGIPGLVLTLEDENESIRIDSAKAIASIGPAGKAASEKLARVAARDSSKPVRLQALRALKAIGPAAIDAVPTLIALFEDPDNQIGVESLETLGVIGKPAVPKLVEKLDDRKQIIRLGAVQALGAIGPDAAAAVPALQSRLKKEPIAVIRANIQSALKTIRSKM
jgi:HEAT repeat protein